MKRRATFIVLLFVAGVAVSVVAAWACAAWAAWPFAQEPSLPCSAWPRPVPEGWPAPSLQYSGKALGSSVLQVRDDPPRHWLSIYRFGWPLRCLEMRVLSVAQEPTGAERPVEPSQLQRFSIPVPSVLVAGTGQWRRSPLRPVWPALAANGVFHGAIFWILARGLGAYRRALRREVREDRLTPRDRSRKLARFPASFVVDELMRRLDEASIPALCVNERSIAEIYLGESSVAVWVVDERDLDRAREILRGVQAETQRPRCPGCNYDLRGHGGVVKCPECGRLLSAPSPDIACPACGEAVPEHFEVCWSCGSRLTPAGGSGGAG